MWRLVLLLAACEVPIPTVARTAMFRARFAYSTGVSYPTGDIDISRQNAKPGWYVDDVSMTAQ